MGCVGTQNTNYDNIKWTGSNFATPGCALEKFSISGGKVISAGVSFAKGNKDTPLYLSHTSTYLQEIHFARNVYVVIYDTLDRRDWLVDGASALLHLVRTQLTSSPYNTMSLLQISEFRHANPHHGANAAQKALADTHNRLLAISEDTESWEETTREVTRGGENKKVEKKSKATTWRFQDLVKQTWRILEQIHDHQTKLLASPGIGLRGTDRDKLEGFGFRDIVEGENPLQPRVAILKPSGRGWVDFTRSLGAINLLGRGFGELITPAEDAKNNLCSAWKHVPKDRDYLTACVSTLEEICTKRGDCDANPLELTQGIY